MTLLIASVFVDRAVELPKLVESAWAGGADAVELRIDALEEDPAAINLFLRQFPDRTWVVTCRSAEEGGRFHGTTMERVSRLIAAARGTGAWVDFEILDWLRSSNIRQKVRMAAARADSSGHRLILSAHDLEGTPEKLEVIAAEMLAAGPEAIAKIAYTAGHVVDSFAALDFMHEHGDRVVAVAMGESGLWTRLLAKKLGAFGSYASLDPSTATAPGQLSLSEMVEQFRWRDIDSSTQVYGVLGDPVAHSHSPALFNRWFVEAGIGAVYLPLRVQATVDGLAQFLDGCAARPWLDIGGFSVTIPHKLAAMRWTGDGADRMAQGIGAANTLCFRSGKVTAHNTDSYASLDSLAEALGRRRTELSGLRVDVLGAGGAARAVIDALRDFGCEATIYCRSEERAGDWAKRYGFKAKAWAERVLRTGEVLVNCTPVGMWPDVEASPMPPDALRGCRLVFDLVYRPLETGLLRDAAMMGCRTLNGLDTFARQAAMQFELWTGRMPDTRTARDWLAREAGSSPAGGQRSRVRQSVVLIGMRGSGKTLVGRELAQLLGVPHVDTDLLVTAAADRSIVEIFRDEGEAGFRRREVEAVRQAVAQSPCVLSAGGGAVLDPRNVEILRGAGTVVWLDAPAEVLWSRIAADPDTARSRPPLTGAEGLDEVRELLAERLPLYAAAADVRVDARPDRPEAVASEILNRLGAG